MLKKTLKLIISIALIILAVRLLDFAAIINFIKTGSLAFFLLAIAINLLHFACMGLRWYWMALPVVERSFIAHMAIYFKATFLNTFTPANVGGDVYRLAVFKSGDVPTFELVKLLIQERILGLYGFLVIYLFAWFWLPDELRFQADSPFTWGAIIAATAIFLPLLALPLLQYLYNTFPQMLAGKYRQKLGVLLESSILLLTSFGLLKLLVVTLLAGTLWIFSIYIVAAGINFPVSFLHLAAVGIMTEILRLIPLTVQGIGMREGVFAYLLGLLLYQHEPAYAVGAMAYLGLSVTIILAGPVGSALEFFAKKYPAPKAGVL